MSLDIKELLGKENILTGFKRITLEELENACNKFITDDLEIGKIYTINEIHKIIRKNIENGIVNLLWEKELDYSIVREFLRIGTWEMQFIFNYEEISVWENVGRYFVKWVQRKNASISNDKVKLIEKPYFEIGIRRNFEVTEIDKSMTLYDFIIWLLEDKRKQLVDRYNTEIEEYTRKIDELNSKIIKMKILEINF